MSSTAPDPISQASSASLVLAPLLERLVAGRRVVVLGEATLGLATELTSRGARLVHVYDPDAGRAAQAMITLGGRNIAYAPLSEDLGVRDGAFDVAILPDLSLFAHPASAIARARQLSGAQGLVVVGCEASPDTVKQVDQRGSRLGYYELYDALSLAFREVKMLGQLPFTGYALVDFGAEGEVAVSVDTSLAEGNPQTPRFFFAIGSDAPIQIEDYTIVEVPAGETQAAASAAVRNEVEALRLRLTEITARAAANAAELESQREARHGLELRIAEEARLKGELSEIARLHEQRAREAIAIAHDTERKVLELAERLRVRESQAHAGENVTRLAVGMQQRVVTLEHELQTVTADLARAEEELRRAAAREQQAARLVADLRAASRAPAPPSGPSPAAIAHSREEQRVLEAKLQRSVDDLRLAEAKIVKLVDEVRDHRALEIKLTKALEDLRLAEGRATQAVELQRAAEAKLAQALAAQGANQKTEAALAAAVAAQKTAESALANARAEQKSLENKLARANADLEALAKRPAPAPVVDTSQADARRAELEARIVKVQDERNVLAAQAVQLVTSNKALEADKTRLAERLARTQRELDTVQDAQAGDFIAAENVLRERSREIAVLQREVERRGGMVKELLAALESAQTEGFTPLPGASAGPDVDGLVEEIGRRRAEVADLSRERAALVDKLAAQGKETTALAGELGTLREEVARLVREQGDRNRELAAAREKLGALTQDPQGRAAALEREVDTLRRALVEARAARLAEGEAASQKAAVENEAAVLRAQTEASGNTGRQS